MPRTNVWLADPELMARFTHARDALPHTGNVHVTSQDFIRRLLDLQEAAVRWQKEGYIDGDRTSGPRLYDKLQRLGLVPEGEC